MTQIIKINDIEEEINKLQVPSEILKNGGTVVFPTETVYGLGANALDEKAVQKIFVAKGRPSDNPLIVHISNVSQVKMLTSEVPEMFEILSKKFWPGPITLVMKKAENIPDIVTAGLDTVGIRMPAHPVALSLIEMAGVPVAAPSANVSGSPSPTKAKHVIQDLNEKVDIIIDGGTCEVGVESTVIDITGSIPVLLRPGGITAEQIKAVVGEIHMDKHILNKFIGNDTKPRSPGVKYKHYSPKAEVILVKGELNNIVEEISNLVEQYKQKGRKVGIMATKQTENLYIGEYIFVCGDRDNPETIANNLFSALRHFDEIGIQVVLVEAIAPKGIGLAIMNRLIKAAGYNVIEAKGRN